MDTPFVTLTALSKQLGLDRSNTRKFVIKQGFTPIKVRDQNSRQLILALTPEQAENILSIRQRQGFASDGSSIVVEGSCGVFYIVQVIPDIQPNRIKLGFSSDMQHRINTYMTLSPTAKTLITWPCKVAWEQAAIDSLTRSDCALIGGEVFDCSDLDKLIERGNAFFEIMPSAG